jgi:hypothetical protein
LLGLLAAAAACWDCLLLLLLAAAAAACCCCCLLLLAMNFCAGDSNECPFSNEMSIYFRFSKNGHSLCQKNSIGHAKIFREFLYFY